MTNRKISALWAAIILALASVSCDKPSDYFQLAGIPENNDGSYSFLLPLNDSTKTYQTRLAARINCWEKNGSDSVVTYEISVKSPGGDCFKEQVDFPLKKIEGIVYARKAGSYVIDMEWPYRNGIRVSSRDLGEWKITIRPVGENNIKATAGMGFYYKETDGKR